MIYLPSSLATGEFTDCTSHLSLRTSHQAIHHASALVSAVASAGRAAASGAAASARAGLPLLASLFALPSSLLGADPFLYHTALLGPNHCLQTLLSVSLFPLRRRPLSQTFRRARDGEAQGDSVGSGFGGLIQSSN